METKSKNDQKCIKKVVSCKKYCFNVSKMYNEYMFFMSSELTCEE